MIMSSATSMPEEWTLWLWLLLAVLVVVVPYWYLTKGCIQRHLSGLKPHDDTESGALPARVPSV
jgi:hypothetical protein